jgi:hypothetical protein
MLACRRTPWSIALSALLLVACKGDGSEDTGANTTTNATPATPSSNTDDTPTTSATPTSTDDTGGTIGTSNVDATSNTASDPSTGTTQGLETVATTLTTDISTTTLSTGQGDTSTSLPDTDTTDTTDAGTTTLDDTTTDADTSTGEPVILDIEVVITADNAYAFAYGSDDDISKYYGGVEAVTAGQIFNCGEGPETYVIPYAETIGTTQLYIIAWADSAVTQGVLARFRRKGGGGGFGEDVFTGTKGWQVCATGIDYQPGSGGPPLAQINEYIGKCNANSLDPNTTSVGWVDEIGTQYGAVAFGEANTTPYDGGPKAGNEFPLVCPDIMPAEAHWMWFNWDPPNVKPPAARSCGPAAAPTRSPVPHLPPRRRAPARPAVIGHSAARSSASAVTSAARSNVRRSATSAPPWTPSPYSS